MLVMICFYTYKQYWKHYSRNSAHSNIQYIEYQLLGDFHMPDFKLRQ